MFAYVKLFSYTEKTFVYHIPEQIKAQIKVGTLVLVPFRKKRTSAIVLSIQTTDQKFPFILKSIDSLYQFPDDTNYFSFLKKIEYLYQVDYCSFLMRIQQFLSQKTIESTIPILEQNRIAQSVTFTDEQQTVIDSINPFLHQNIYQPFLLHGVTGSGKTEIYKHIAQQILSAGKVIIIMFPEVSLALKFEKTFADHFDKHLVFSFHCATTPQRKKELWQALLASKPMIIVGVHLPILLPIANLGFIIVDEEHDAGYQEKKHPKLHSRDMAILKASIHKVPILLGSATPSIQSLYNAKQKNWIMLSMKKRYAGDFPEVKIVILKNQKKRANFWISDPLIAAITDRLEKKEQIIIFLNRRGFSFFVQCRCGFVFTCHQCSVSLTLHQGSLLVCHYCASKQHLASTCPSCKSSSIHFLKKGIGTQQVVSLLAELFPQASIERADLDSTSKKRSWNQTVTDMQNGLIDILVGTQSITKGYHFPNVTLIGVLWADLNLHFPMYNAAEICLQQLIQVAGRAGRQSSNSCVIVQAFDNHPIFQFLNEQNYLRFYEHELQKRVAVGYPPYKHIAEIEIKSTQEEQTMRDAQLILTALNSSIHKNDIEIFGPVQSLIHKIKDIYSSKIYIKSFSRKAIIESYRLIEKIESSIHFVIDFV